MTPHDPDQGGRDDWPQRLHAAVAQTIAARQARRDLRHQLAAARDAGLERRHTAKLDRRDGHRVSDAAAASSSPEQDAELGRTGTAKLPEEAQRPGTPPSLTTGRTGTPGRERTATLPVDADALVPRTGTPVQTDRRRTSTASDAQGPTTPSQVETVTAAGSTVAAHVPPETRAADVGRRTGTATDAPGPATADGTDRETGKFAGFSEGRPGLRLAIRAATVAATTTVATVTATDANPAVDIDEGHSVPHNATPTEGQDVPLSPNVDIRISQAATLARLRRAGQSGWRPRRDTHA